MLGAIIGDIVGSRWEFNPTNDYNFEWMSNENGFTDDTICTVAVADAILHNSEDFGKYIHEWCRKYPNPMGSYGGRFALWVRSDNPQPYNSLGNGSSMRVSPVAWAANDLEFKYLLDVAEKSAACSHNHPEGIKGAQTVALAIQYGIELPCYHPNFTQLDITSISEKKMLSIGLMKLVRELYLLHCGLLVKAHRLRMLCGKQLVLGLMLIPSELLSVVLQKQSGGFPTRCNFKQ